MPSQAIRPALHRMSDLQNTDTWTDCIPRCRNSGIGVSANQMYREDGTPCSEHEYEDRSIHFCLDNANNTFLYGVFDGHDGTRAANFASQRMPAELSFDQLEGKNTEEEVRDVFQQAFLSVENAFLESIDPKIAERTQLLEKIPDNMSQFEAAQQYPETIVRLQDLEEEIRGGAACAVCLVHKGMLYVGNVGDSRALLCQKDKFGVLKVKQLTIDHTTSSHDELERLSLLSLDISKIKGAKLGSHNVTRCIGNYFLKGGYMEFEMLSSASAEPVIPQPYIMSMPIDASCSFLLMMSDGLYKSYEEATGSKQANKEIATMVVEQFLEQPTLTSVAQTVVDKVVRLHHDMFLTQKNNITKRDDITLIIRNFNFQFPKSFYSQGAFLAQNQQRMFDAINQIPEAAASIEDLTLCEGLPKVPNRVSFNQEDECIGAYSGLRGNYREEPRNFFASIDPSDVTQDSNIPSGFHASGNTTSTESSKLSNPSLTQLTLDEDGYIKPYVNFDMYYRAIYEAIANGTIPKSQINNYK